MAKLFLTPAAERVAPRGMGRRLQTLLHATITKYRWINAQVWTIAKRDSPEESRNRPPKPPARCC